MIFHDDRYFMYWIYFGIVLVILFLTCFHVNSGMLASRRLEHVKWTYVNMTSLAITHQLSRIRCLETCLRDEACKAVNYGNNKTCVLYRSVPRGGHLLKNQDWSLIIL